MRKTLKADANVDFHIIEWEECCMEEAETRQKNHECEQTGANDEQSAASSWTMLVSWEEKVEV